MTTRSVAIAVTALGLVVLAGEASAQGYSPYSPPPPPGYRGAPGPVNDDDDLVPLLGTVVPMAVPSTPYGYGYEPPQSGTRGDRSETTLPPPGQGGPYAAAPPQPYGAQSAPYGSAYPDSAPPPRGYSYGAWEPSASASATSAIARTPPGPGVPGAGPSPPPYGHHQPRAGGGCAFTSGHGRGYAVPDRVPS